MTFNPFSPDTPPRVHIEALPEMATIASYTLDPQGLIISAYLPKNWAQSFIDGTDNHNDRENEFIRDFCEECSFYTGSTIDLCDIDTSCHYIEVNGVDCEIEEAQLVNPCPCYISGIGDVDFPCADGHDGPEDENSIESGYHSLNAMCISVVRDSRFGVVHHTVALQAAAEVDGVFRYSSTLRAINTYPDDKVCWGNDNSKPTSLLEAAVTYATAEGNNDLLSTAAFIQNNMHALSVSKHNSAIPNALPLPEGRKALIFASLKTDPTAYLLLRSTIATADDGIVCTPATWNDQRDCWVTPPSTSGHHWLIAHAPAGSVFDPDKLQGIILGQLSTEELACSPTH